MKTSNLHYLLFLCLLVTACKSPTDPATDGNPDPNPDPTPNANECTVVASDISIPFEGVGGKGVGFALGRVLADNARVYWFEYDETGGNSGGAIKSAPSGGGSVSTIADGLSGLNGLEMDESHLYWVEFDIDSGDGIIKKVSKSGGSPTILADGFPETPGGTTSPYDIFSPLSLTLDADSLCFGEPVGGSAVRCVSKSGGAVKDFGRGGNFDPLSLTQDADYFYILDGSSNGQILRLAKSDQVIDTLATGFATSGGLGSLLLDEGTLYWVETKDNGDVFKLPAGGGTLSTVDNGLTNPRVVIGDATSIYYVAGNGVFMMDKSSESTGSAASCSNASSTYYIGQDADNLFIMNATQDPNSGMILKSAK